MRPLPHGAALKRDLSYATSDCRRLKYVILFRTPPLEVTIVVPSLDNPISTPCPLRVDRSSPQFPIAESCSSPHFLTLLFCLSKS